jgi:hypothetical protein
MDGTELDLQYAAGQRESFAAAEKAIFVNHGFTGSCSNHSWLCALCKTPHRQE